MSWRAVILAAGKGTRMKSEEAKVLHRLQGETLLDHVLKTASRLPIEKSAVIVGFQHEKVREVHTQWDAEYLLQEPQLGTGHAVQQAAGFLSGHGGSTLVLYGDVPLLRRSTLLELMEEHTHSRNAATVLTARVREPAGYGRIIRAADGSLEAIVEDKDLSPGQHAVDEINSGIYAYETPILLDALSQLSNDNKQREYYLTDTIKSIRRLGLRVGTYTAADETEISGINDAKQLAEAGAILTKRRGEGSTDCPVCSLAEREGKAAYPILMKGEHAFLAVVDRPYNAGQLCVYPKRHMLRHAALEDEELRELWDLGRLASEIVREIYHPQGMNLAYTNGHPGEHLALRIVPRWVGDTNFMPLVAGVTLLPEAPGQTFERMKRLLAERGNG